jgi:hypothetical protein
MRTMVTLASDVAAKLKKMAQRSGRSFRAILDEARLNRLLDQLDAGDLADKGRSNR